MGVYGQWSLKIIEPSPASRECSNFWGGLHGNTGREKDGDITGSYDSTERTSH